MDLDHLRRVLELMREHGVHELHQGDLRISLAPAPPTTSAPLQELLDKLDKLDRDEGAAAPSRARDDAWARARQRLPPGEDA